MKSTKYVINSILSAALFLGFTPFSYAADGSEPVQILDSVNYSVNVNKADADEMATLLKGIGTKKAQAIIEYREEHGPFANVMDLTNVKGIGPSLISNNRDTLSIE